MGALFSSPVAETKSPVKGILSRFKNVIKIHFRGLIGFFFPFILLTAMGGEHKNHAMTTQSVWIWMFWFFLLQPVNVPVTGMIPVFIFPFTGVMSTEQSSGCYFNEGISLMVLGGIATMLMNDCGMDRRFAVSLLSYGSAQSFSPTIMIIKSSLTAFILSMLCNRLLACAVIYELFRPVYENEAKNNEKIASLRDVINIAIQTSSVLGFLTDIVGSYGTLGARVRLALGRFLVMFGSATIVHNSFPVIAFKAIIVESNKLKDDIFNYFQYFIFALPIALIMLILNMTFLVGLIKWVIKPQVTAEQTIAVSSGFQQYRNDLPPITWRERLSFFFTLVIILMYFCRWTQWSGYIWATPGTKDATIATIFVVLLHVLPMDVNFIRIFFAHRRKDLPSVKPASGLLWWKFVDNNTNYAYILVIGAGVALLQANVSTGLVKTIQSNVEPVFDLGWPASTFVLLLITTVLANIMTGTAACMMILPMVMCFGSTETWKNMIHLGALGVGFASNFGFMTPFRFTPAFHCHNIGKTSWKQMAKYSIGCVLICMIVLWLALCLFAPAVWSDVAYVVPAVPSKPGARVLLRTTTREIYKSQNGTIKPKLGRAINGTSVHKMFKYLLNRTASDGNFSLIESTTHKVFDYETLTFITNGTTTHKLLDSSQSF